LNVSEGDLGPDTDFLVGIDIIAEGDFVVQNRNGKSEFSFCVPPCVTSCAALEKPPAVFTVDALRALAELVEALQRRV
jgi:hypothetical protein